MDTGTLLKRTASGLVFLAIVVGCLLHPVGVLALACFLAVALSHEFYRLTTPRRYRKEEILVMTAMVVSLSLLHCSMHGLLPMRFVLLGLLPVLAAFFSQLFEGAREHEFVTEPYFPLIYILPALMGLVRIGDWRLTLGLFIILWCSDIGAYCLGMLLGQRPGSRKLFPALSPKKSWVGFFGGAAFALLSAWAYWAIAGDTVLPLVHWIVLAVIVVAFGVPGDLFESLIKRHAGVKDAGTLIPGHGGLLDRFDDFLFVVPAALVYLVIFSLL